MKTKMKLSSIPEVTRADIIKQAAVAGGNAIKMHSPSEGVVKKSGKRGDFVTAADLASDKAIRDLILQNFPKDQILSEEVSQDISKIKRAKNLWIIDPLDGTHNFRFGIKYCGVSVGYAEEGELVLSAIYDFNHEELYFAERGKGAFCNGKPIKIGSEKNIHNASVAIDMSYDPELAKKNIGLVLTIDPLPWVLLRGSAAITFSEVASGKIDLYAHGDIKPWDNAAGFLLVSEAGGMVRDLNGKKVDFYTNNMVAGNKVLVEKFSEILKKNEQATNSK